MFQVFFEILYDRKKVKLIYPEQLIFFVLATNVRKDLSNMVKLLRAYGECLGARSLRRTW